MIEDGGFSFEPLYWLNRAQPALRGGKAAASYENLDYPGHGKPAYGAEIGIPAGPQNTLRISYFRAQGNSNSTLASDTTLFSTGYNTGDYLTANYTLQNAKISWDYLSYTWYRPDSRIRLKTLYEVQYTNISTNINAPFKSDD